MIQSLLKLLDACSSTCRWLAPSMSWDTCWTSLPFGGTGLHGVFGASSHLCPPTGVMCHPWFCISKTKAHEPILFVNELHIALLMTQHMCHPMTHNTGAPAPAGKVLFLHIFSSAGWAMRHQGLICYLLTTLDIQALSWLNLR